MLFSEKPKTRLEDFFDRRDELKQFSSLVERSPVVVKGIRRIGKSSLIKVGLGLLEQPYIYLDLRGVAINKKISIRTIFELLSASETSSKSSRFVQTVKDAVREVSIASVFTIRLAQERTRNLLLELFRKLDKAAKAHAHKLVIVFDEAQVLRFATLDMRELLANVYDNMENITLVFAGSQIGVLKEFIGIEDPYSPFYGRYMAEVELKPFSRELSLEFLKQGFNEFSLKPDERFLERAVNELDGIVGWLTFFGLKVAERRKFSEETIEEVLNIAATLEKKEIEALPKSQKLVLSALSRLDNPRWSDIKRMSDSFAGRKLNDAEVNRALKSLIRYSFIEKKGESYTITDPITKKAAVDLTPD
jgi:AAA+ ATPase superfamily predicted ATPase